jgi:hypothetical protein
MAFLWSKSVASFQIEIGWSVEVIWLLPVRPSTPKFFRQILGNLRPA